MSDEYIKRSDVLELAREYYTPSLREEAVPVKAIKNIPSADVRHVVRGKWIDCRDGYTYCSVCGEDAINKLIKCGCGEIQKTPFCPHCGARMDGEGINVTTKDGGT